MLEEESGREAESDMQTLRGESNLGVLVPTSPPYGQEDEMKRLVRDPTADRPSWLRQAAPRRLPPQEPQAAPRHLPPAEAAALGAAMAQPTVVASPQIQVP